MHHIRECMRGAFEALLRQYEDDLHLPWVFEGPLEEAFVVLLEKHLHHSVRLRSQVSVTAGGQRFRLDFVADSSGSNARRIGIECDGKHFHDAARDERRDRAILDADVVDAVYRISGSSFYWQPHHCLLTLAHAEPWLLSQRGHVNVERLANFEMAELLKYEDDYDDEDRLS